MIKKRLLIFLTLPLFFFPFFNPVPSRAVSLVEEDQQAIAAYRQAREEYLQAVSTFRQARQDYLAAREKLKTLKDATQTKETLEKAKNFLLKADQTAIKYLKMVRKKVETTSGLTEAERQASLNEIDSDISWLTEKQAEIQTATTKEELKTLASQVKNHWQKVRADVKRITGQILAAKANKVIARLEEIGKRIETGINQAKNAGRDTPQLEAWLADYQKNLILAKEKYQAAKTKFEAISNLAEANALFNQGTAFIKEANLYLRQAHRNLKDIVREWRKNYS